MSGSPKEKGTVSTLLTHTEETEDAREVYLRDGRKLVISDAGTDQLVEVRSESGMVEVRIRLTEQGPVLQMDAVRLQIKAEEKVEIESKRVEIKATETVAIDGNKVTVDAKEEGVEIDADGAVRVIGKTIHLN